MCSLDSSPYIFSIYSFKDLLTASRGLNKSSNWSTMNSNKSSKIKPLWEGGCDDDDMCEFADKDDYAAVGSVRIFLQTLAFQNIASTFVVMCIWAGSFNALVHVFCCKNHPTVQTTNVVFIKARFF